MNQTEYDIVVIGGGPSGLLAAGKAAMDGARVLLLEKMEKPARKLRITGKGRCNITNLYPLEDFLQSLNPEPLFLKDALAQFYSDDIISILEKQKVKVVVERGKRVFPESGKAWDVADALARWAKSFGALVSCHSKVTRIHSLPNSGWKVRYENPKEKTIRCKAVIIATGGKSYPATGSTGDGYSLAARCGHTVTPLLPALVELETEPLLFGGKSVLLKNVNLTLYANGTKKGSEFGEIEPMPYGFGGAIAVRVSRNVVGFLDQGMKVEMELDLKPALDHKKLDNRILREIESNPRMSILDLSRKLLPKPLAELMLKELRLVYSRKVSTLSSEERKRIRLWLKEKRYTVTGHRSWKQAIVTAGGISLKEINPHTLESKLHSGLYFAGEVMDVDGPTGGYNLQIAYSTGWLAGLSAAKRVIEQKNLA